MKVFKKIIKILKSGFSECAKCEKYSECDKKPWLHRNEEGCNYGKIHN